MSNKYFLILNELQLSYFPGVDDAESECGVDTGVDFDIVITNNGSGDASLDSSISHLVQQVLSRLPKEV